MDNLCEFPECHHVAETQLSYQHGPCCGVCDQHLEKWLESTGVERATLAALLPTDNANVA
jgi:hypothetical protein